MSEDSIEAQVRVFNEHVGSLVPSPVAEVLEAERQRIITIAGSAEFVKEGEKIDPFSLPDATGAVVHLGALLVAGPAVLVFYRGAWCPFCNIALATYQRDLLPELRARGIGFAAISPQLPDGSLTMTERHGLQFPVLSDVENRVASSLGLTFTVGEEARAIQASIGTDLTATNGQKEPTLPIPATLLVAQDRTVLFADVRPDFNERTEVTDITAAIDRHAVEGSLTG